MNRWQKPASVSHRILIWVSALVPVLFFLALLQGPVRALANGNRSRQTELEGWNGNVYRDGWLDSAQQALRADRDFLAGVQDRVERRLIPASPAGETMLDSLRREAQSFGCEVIRLAPTRDSAGPLRRLRLRVDARADFPAALAWFQDLERRRPSAYVEEALLRPDARGKVEINLTVLFHSRVSP